MMQVLPGRLLTGLAEDGAIAVIERLESGCSKATGWTRCPVGLPVVPNREAVLGGSPSRSPVPCGNGSQGLAACRLCSWLFARRLGELWRGPYPAATSRWAAE